MKNLLLNTQAVTMLDVPLYDDQGTSFIQEIPAADEGFIYALSGQGYSSSDRKVVNAGQIGYLAHTSVIDVPTRLNVTAKKLTRFLL